MKRASIAVLTASCFCLLGCDQGTLSGPDIPVDPATTTAKPGGKPGEPTPPGVIYAILDGSAVEMDGDGSVLRTLDPVVQGSPSYELHGGQRWFVYTDGLGDCDSEAPDPSVCYPDGSSRHELFGVNESGAVVQLTNDPLFHPMRWPHWSPAPADGQIAFRGRRFSSSSAAADEGGIYVADVSFASGAPAVSSISLRIAGTMEDPDGYCAPGSICFTRPDIVDADWSPDGTRLVYSVIDLPEPPSGWPTTTSIFISGDLTPLASPGAFPVWSSQNLILFSTVTLERNHVKRMWTIRSDGSAETQVGETSDKSKGMKWTTRHFYDLEWSPDGDHFAYRFDECDFPAPISCSSDLIRRKADGSGEKELASSEWSLLLGWR